MSRNAPAPASRGAPLLAAWTTPRSTGPPGGGSMPKSCSPSFAGSARAATFVGMKDDIVRRLTGVIGSDPTHAAYTMLYDVGTQRWATELVELARIPASLLPALRFAADVAGEVTPDAARMTGLLHGIPVITGTSDGTAAGLLAGLEPGVAVNVTGTSDVVMARADVPLYDPDRRTLVNPHPLGDGFMIGAVLGTSGGTLHWLVDRFCPDLTGDDRYRRLDDEIARVPLGARGVVCLAGLAGERAPRWNAAARGAFVGLDLAHGRADLARAVLESVALSIRSVVGALRDLGADVRTLRLVGGGARSDLWSPARAQLARHRALAQRRHALTASSLRHPGSASRWHADWSATRQEPAWQERFLPLPFPSSIPKQSGVRDRTGRLQASTVRPVRPTA